MIGIVGGGLSGLCLKYLLKRPSEILEKELRVGGLCRTFRKDGFSYDIGGHILYSKDEAAVRFWRSILGSNLARRRRNNKVLFKGRYVKYPFENDLGSLDPGDAYECLVGYLKNTHPKPVNFREWIYHTFGDGIAEKYLLPYNAKIWKFPLERMGVEWVERVPRPPVEDVVKSALGIPTEGYSHQLYFDYPKRGGIESLIAGLAKGQDGIETGFDVASIERRGREFIVAGEAGARRYRELVLTMPLDRAVRCLGRQAPASVVRAASGLGHSAVRIVLVGLKNASLLDKSAIYIPDGKILPHRVCFMGYFSPNNVPRGKSSLIAEVSTRRGQGLYRLSAASLTERVVKDLDRAGIIRKKDVAVTEVQDIEYGYVIYDRDYRRNVERVKSCFRSLGIRLLGRFGEFEYINMDEVIRRSASLAKELNRGR
jgi:protoporphyrinogen oxidase